MGDDQTTRVVRNAKRLLRDAVLLNDKGRHASAFALAVLGLEEIGKAILRRWGLLDSEGRFHLRKQMAVSSLLLLDAAVREAQQAVSGPSEFTPDVQERVVTAVVEGEAGRFSQLVTIKMVDTMKLFALYYDGELEGAGFHPDQFNREDVETIFKMCSRALNEIDDENTMRLARKVFLAKKETRPDRSPPRGNA